MSNMAMLILLRRMSRHGIMVHGFRSTFRDWIAECKEYPNSLAEEALAHIITPQTVAAYRRRDQLERRRLMMEDWGAYCAGDNPHAASIRSATPRTFAAYADTVFVSTSCITFSLKRWSASLAPHKRNGPFVTEWKAVLHLSIETGRQRKVAARIDNKDNPTIETTADELAGVSVLW